jgi:hypothetical protein
MLAGQKQKKKQLRTNTEKYMLSLQSNPQKVANFFKHPKVAYAAA